MKVLFLTNIPSPYRVAFFNELGKLCDLTVVFETGFSSERDESWKDNKFEYFKGIVLSGKRVKKDRAFTPEVKKYLLKTSYDRILVSNIASPTGIYSVFLMKLHKIAYWVEGDGAFLKEREGIRKILKKWIISGAKGCFSTSETHDLYYLKYGAKKQSIYRYPFTSLYQSDICNKPYTKTEKKTLKDELGVCENKMVLSVGQFIERKGFDLLIKVAAELPESVGVYFVGGLPTEEYIKLADNRKNIHFVGFKTPGELKNYYGAADIFVLPTREDIWGLVINEAMANGLPIITTDRCGAGLSLISNNDCGEIVLSGDKDALKEAIDVLLQDELRCKACASCSLEKIKRYTVENMALVHKQILDENG